MHLFLYSFAFTSVQVPGMGTNYVDIRVWASACNLEAIYEPVPFYMFVAASISFEQHGGNGIGLFFM